jgi:hypothetical protein
VKVIWEAQDIIVGRKFKLPSSNETWMIGYIPSCVGKEKYAKISMSDGMVTDTVGVEYMADSLNADGSLPIELIRE